MIPTLSPFADPVKSAEKWVPLAHDHERVAAAGVRTLVEPFDGPFGPTFAMADPDGYRITIYEKDQPLFWPPKLWPPKPR